MAPVNPIHRRQVATYQNSMWSSHLSMLDVIFCTSCGSRAIALPTLVDPKQPTTDGAPTRPDRRQCRRRLLGVSIPHGADRGLIQPVHVVEVGSVWGSAAGPLCVQSAMGRC